jgi:hypothetical protein
LKNFSGTIGNRTHDFSAHVTQYSLMYSGLIVDLQIKCSEILHSYIACDDLQVSRYVPMLRKGVLSPSSGHFLYGVVVLPLRQHRHAVFGTLD